MPTQKKIDQIRVLKKEAHDLIDGLVRTRLSRDGIYIRLASRLGVSEKGAHFQAMYTEREVLKAIKELQAMTAERRAYIKKVREARKERARETARKAREATVPEVVVTTQNTGAASVTIDYRYEGTDGGEIKKRSLLEKLLNFIWGKN